MGALTSAFIPVFTKYVTQKNEKEGLGMAAALINLSVVVLTVISIPILIWTTEISRFFAPGFSTAQIAQMVSFTRLMVITQVLPLLVGNFFTGILQSYNLFLVPALAPVVYNLGIIMGIIFLSSRFGLYGAVIGVGIGALLFMCIQLPLVIAVGYRHRWDFNFRHPGVRDVLRLITPRTLGLAVSQIDSTVDLMLSSLLGASMVTVFNFAQQLQQLPVGLFGVTVAQAALPTLSAASANEDMNGFKSSIISGIHQILFFVLPASAMFIVLRIPVVRLVFGASRFTWEATVLTGMTLSMFAVSIFAQSIVNILARGFYALYDTKTPVAVGVMSIIINTTASVYFIKIAGLPVWSLGLSTSVASIINATVLFILLNRRVGGFANKELFLPAIKMFVAAVIAGVVVFFPLKVFDQLVFDTTRTFGLLMLTGIAGGAGLVTYVLLAWVFDVSEVKSFIALISRVRKPKAVILEPVNEVINGGIQDKIT
jgi:putative peptidoglycan lipid II flippase